MRRRSALTPAFLCTVLLAPAPRAEVPLGPSPAAEEIAVHRNDRGEPLLAFYGLDSAEKAAVTAQAGADLSRSPSMGNLVLEASDNNGQAQTYNAPLFRVSTRSWATEEHIARIQSGKPYSFHAMPGRQEVSLSVAGRTATATWSRPGEGSHTFTVEDSLGGKIQYRELPKLGPKWVQDKDGFVLGVDFDDFGRARRILIGLDYVLETTYPDSTAEPNSWNWTERRLMDAPSGQTLHVWKWSEVARAPRPGAKLLSEEIGIVMGTGPVIAEWDKELYPEGVAIVPARRVSVLVPLAGDGQVWRSVELPRQDTSPHPPRPSYVGRLDFTETEFRLWIHLGHPAVREEGPLASVSASAVVTLPRLPATPERLEEFRKRGSF